MPFYGSDRLGTFTPASNNYVYELRDNVGSVRAVVGQSSPGVLDVRTFDDYYPFGSVAQSGGTTYRYQYQGAYAEKDDVTGFNNFELRMYDGKLGRWLSVDPGKQYSSPYEAMGNNPASSFDMKGDSSWVSIGGGIDGGFHQMKWSADVYDQEDATAMFGKDATFIGNGVGDGGFTGTNADGSYVQLNRDGTMNTMLNAPMSAGLDMGAFQAGIRQMDPLLAGTQITGEIVAGLLVPGGGSS